MKSNALVNIDSLKNLERTILIAGSIVLLSGVVLLFRTGLTHFQYLESESKSELTKKEIQSLTATIEKSKLIKFTSIQTQELNVVQKSMDQLATQNHCQLQEVTSTNDTVPMSTRYKKSADEKGWKQLALSGQIVGSLPNVMAFARGLSNISIPIELVAMEIAPTGSDKESKVTAKISFTILKQESSR
jgi:hypothetical protein